MIGASPASRRTPARIVRARLAVKLDAGMRYRKTMTRASILAALFLVHASVGAPTERVVGWYRVTHPADLKPEEARLIKDRIDFLEKLRAEIDQAFIDAGGPKKWAWMKKKP